MVRPGVTLFALLAFAANFMLPGTWLAFSPLLDRFGGWTRLLFAAVFSIPVASAEYEVLRAFGLGSDSAVAALFPLNLPALFLVWRGRGGLAIPSVKDALGLGLAIAIPVLFLAVAFATHDEKAYWGHIWLHTDMIYALRENAFAPEERQLAGLVATYPWIGHLFFLIQSTTLDESPLRSFTAINLVLATAYGGFAVATMRRLGAGRVGMLAAPFLFSFALNPVGVAFANLALATGNPLARWSYLAGDPRYDFLLIKFLRLNLNQVGLVMLAALLLLIVAPQRDRADGRRLALLMSLMVLITTLHYPLYLPVALGFVAARAVAELGAGHQGDRRFVTTVAFGSAIAAVVAAKLVLLPLGPRFIDVGIGVAGPGLIWRHGVMVATACSLPALAALWLWAGPARRPFGRAEATLLIAGAGCAMLAVFTNIPNKDNEYKFVLAAGLALMPFLALALDEAFRHFRRGPALVGMAALTGLCIYGATDSVSRREMQDVDTPPLVYQGLFQTVAANDPLAGAIAAIRERTPESAVLLADDTPVEMSVLTLRAQYVPWDPDRIHPGMTFRNVYLLTNVKGYDPAIVSTRRQDLTALFDGPGADARSGALARIRALGRPIVLLIAAGRHPGFTDWLGGPGGGERIHADAGYEVWLLAGRD